MMTKRMLLPLLFCGVQVMSQQARAEFSSSFKAYTSGLLNGCARRVARDWALDCNIQDGASGSSIYQFYNGAWNQIPGLIFGFVTTDQYDRPWTLNTVSGEPEYWDGSDFNTYDRDFNHFFTSIAVGDPYNPGEVWGVDNQGAGVMVNDGTLDKGPGGWIAITGTTAAVKVAVFDEVVACLNPKTGAATKIRQPFYINSSGAIFMYNVTATQSCTMGQFASVSFSGGTATDITTDAVMTSNGNVFFWSSASNSFSQGGQRASAIGGGHAQNWWMVNSSTHQPMHYDEFVALNTPPTFAVDTALLLTNGNVMVHQTTSSNWYALKPDNTGNYQAGTWTQLASMPAAYGPRYFASAVLPDGRVIVEGGEYNLGPPTETNLGAIYDPVANSWTSVSPPSGWLNIGDAPSAVLANGTFMMGQFNSTAQARFNASNLTWTTTGTGKADSNSEEGWTLLPNGQLLTIDTENGIQSELYNPTTGAWSLAGNTVVQLPLALPPYVAELGPAMLMPNGNVFATGATSNTAIYNSGTATWSVGPTLPPNLVQGPGDLGIADGPAALLPNGNVLVAASTYFTQPTRFFEYNGTTLTEVQTTPAAAGTPAALGNLAVPGLPCFQMRFLVLPSGKIMSFAEGTSEIRIYGGGGSPNSAWTPAITSVPTTLTRGRSFTISGRRFNGMSQAVQYGDDAQAATNYPLVTLTNIASGHVIFARTHNHSTMAVATGNTTVSTTFDVPSSAETGQTRVAVIANGLKSASSTVTIQ
jgi:hypothetical protein